MRSGNKTHTAKTKRAADELSRRHTISCDRDIREVSPSEKTRGNRIFQRAGAAVVFIPALCSVHSNVT